MVSLIKVYCFEELTRAGGRGDGPLTSNRWINQTLSVLLCKPLSPFSKASPLPPPLPLPAEEAEDQGQEPSPVPLTGQRDSVTSKRHVPRDGEQTSPLPHPPSLGPEPIERR